MKNKNLDLPNHEKISRASSLAKSIRIEFSPPEGLQVGETLIYD